MRWNPSAATDVYSYQLAVWTSPTAADAGTAPPAQLDIAVVAAGVEATTPRTILFYDIEGQQLGGIQGFQLEPGATYYLRMRALTWAGLFSEYSNRIAVVAASAALMGATSGSAGGTSAPASAGSRTGTTSGMTSGTTSNGSQPASSQAAIDPSSLTSVDLDGVSEYLGSSAAQLLGISDRFTLSLWARSAAQDSARRGLFSLRGSAPGNQDRLELTARGQDLEFVFYNSSGEAAYQATYPDVLLEAEWQHLVLAYDSQLDSEPTVFVDGVLQAAAGMVATGAAATFSDSARRVHLGAGDAGWSEPWWGAMGDAALWDVALGDAEIQEISQRGHAIDLNQQTGAYQGQDALLHYWRPGHDLDAVGFDYGAASVPVDLDDTSGNVDASDVTPEDPALRVL